MPANIWSYAGEAGKRLNGNARPFTGDSAQFDFIALNIDRCRWEVPLRNFVPGAEEFPEEGQTVSFYRNSQRFFFGHALRPDRNGNRVNVDVVGPWHWLEKIQLTTAITLDAASGGGSGVRTTIGFPAQSMTVSLGTLIDRCIALGVPMIKGTIATCFACIPITLNQGSCAQAISELVRLIGDMVVSFDYTGAGFPVINITRRLAGLSVGSMSAVTLDASIFTPGQFKLTPMDELRASQVRVPFYDRGPTGARRYQEQKAGTAELGHVMILTASGKELDTFLPEEKLDGYVLQTAATSGTTFKNWVLNKSGSIVAAGQVAGIPPQSLPLNIGPVALSYQTYNQDLPGTNKTIPIAGPKFLNGQGQTVSTAGKNILVSDNLPEWLKDQFVVEEVTVVCPVYYEWRERNWPGGVWEQVPQWWYSVQWAGDIAAGFKGSSSTNYASYRLFIHNAEIRAYLINASAPAGQQIYRQPDYTFIAPPAGFATGLLNARNWTPYQGTCGWMEQDCGAQRYANKLISVVGADPEFESMGAMVQSETLNIRSGVTTLRLGPPQRHSFRDLTQAVRSNSNDQVVFL
ncbi:hypothetical protein [Luteolibacter luteus]|uniref:Uncharacterized protein n=1 Tax=Luteolibacter luteus TaxID=2728835 RepID=A0A858RH98_9BACT|nr:hypothetical protein [Luteolibacter luteus]QJE95951.1 hypothetical protein HHL09_09210 [Luteolibacter luteus]